MKDIQLKVKGYIDNSLKVYETHREDAVIIETETTYMDDRYTLRCHKTINGKRAYHESQITRSAIVYTSDEVLEALINETFDYGFKNLK